MGSRITTLSWVAAAAATAATTAPASAQAPGAPVQEISPAAPGGEGVQVFDPSFFSVYNPVTAYDMVRQVPGFSIDDGEQLRGFGATAGNVLINGERPSTKRFVSNELGLIPASSVERIELIRGGARDLDVRGRTVVVNVILADGAAAAPVTTYSAFLGWHALGGRLTWDGSQLSRTFRFAGADMTLDITTPTGQWRSVTDELVTGAGGDVRVQRDEYFQDTYREVVLSWNAGWKPSPRDVFNVNVRGSTWRFDGDELSNVLDLTDAPDHVDVNAIQEVDSHFLEVGADWERELTPGMSIKLVALDTDLGWNWSQRFESFPLPEGDVVTSLQHNPGGRGERVGRATLTWRPNEAHRLEAGLEGAFNFRDTNLSITSNGEPVDCELCVTRVEELRAEPFVTDVWTISPDLTLETGFTFEASRITQTGTAEQGVIKEREFMYPKPRIITTYAATDRDQIRLSLLREVAQLNFNEFASSVSFSNNTSDRGNENLEPEQTWRARAEWERRFGERSTITLAAFYDAVEKVQDLIPIDVDGDGPGDGNGDGVGDATAPGNLGDGMRWGGSVEGVMMLDRIGLSNAQLKYEGVLQRTRVDDPVTGAPRSFTNEADWEYTIEFRQDLPAKGFAWGWDYFGLGALERFRVDEVQIFREGSGDLDVFVETTRWGGATVRFGVDNVFDSVETTERLFFMDSRANSGVEQVELRDKRFGQLFYVRLSGSF